MPQSPEVMERLTIAVRLSGRASAESHFATAAAPSAAAADPPRSKFAASRHSHSGVADHALPLAWRIPAAVTVRCRTPFRVAYKRAVKARLINARTTYTA